jgi:hypothetical protein
MNLPFQVEQEETKNFKPPHLRFEDSSIKDNTASLQAGRAVYNPALKVFIRSPGDDKCEVPYVVEKLQKDPLTGKDELIHPWEIHLKEKLHHGFIQREYFDFCMKSVAHWKENQETMVKGTPISEWPLLSKSEADNLKSIGILSIENCAEMTEEAMAAYGMGARMLKDKAGNWLGANSNPGQSAEKINSLEANLQAAVDRADEAATLMGGYEQKIAQLEAMMAESSKTPPPEPEKMDFTTLSHEELVTRVKGIGLTMAHKGWSKEKLIEKLNEVA